MSGSEKPPEAVAAAAVQAMGEAPPQTLHVAETAAGVSVTARSAAHPPSAVPETNGDDENKAAAAALKGLSSAEVEQLREKYGWNEVKGKKAPWWQDLLLRYFSLVPLILLIAAILGAAVEKDGQRDWVGFGLLLGLMNVVVLADFFVDKSSANAMEAVEKLSAPTCVCRRDGKWETVAVRELVPGDVVSLRGGAVVPADGRLIGEGEPMSIDESSLTGESLPATKRVGDDVLSGGTVVRGELPMIVEKTGYDSFFGKTIALLDKGEGEVGHLRKVLSKAATIIIVAGALICLAILAIKIFRDQEYWLVALELAFVILAVAAPAGFSLVTAFVLSEGAKVMASEKAVVQRLSAIEEMAGMEILCSDKTGTLTKNQLSLDPDEAILAEGVSKEDLLLLSSFASVALDEHPEPIDLAIGTAAQKIEGYEASRKAYKMTRFIPFNPVDKVAVAFLETTAGGPKVEIVKGAPHIIRNMVVEAAQEGEREQLLQFIEDGIANKASRGLRTLGVARKERDSEGKGDWKLLGYVSLFDPPRDDTKDTIERAHDLGVEVKMITGDQQAIAIETARRLGMGTDIMGPEIWECDTAATPFFGSPNFTEYCKKVAGFSGVYPEHKFAVVEALMKFGAQVGMTGDGVNDAPALKRATVGVAVAGATEAARAAADIALLAPGLSTIVTALILSRQIFRRVETYIIYRIACSTLYLLFFFLALWAFKFEFPSWILVVLGMLNDISQIVTGYDRVVSDKYPKRWSMVEVSVKAFTMGIVATGGNLLFVWLSAQSGGEMDLNLEEDHQSFWSAWGLRDLSDAELVASVYLNMSINVQLMFFACRTKELFWFPRDTTKMPPLSILSVLFAILLGSTFLAVYIPDVHMGATPIEGMPWPHAGVTWLYGLVTVFFMDLFKFVVFFIYSTPFSSLTGPLRLRFGSPEERRRQAEKELRKMQRERQAEQMKRPGAIMRKVSESQQVFSAAASAHAERVQRRSHAANTISAGVPRFVREMPPSSASGVAGVGLTPEEELQMAVFRAASLPSGALPPVFYRN